MLEKHPPTLRVNTLFYWCNDVAIMRTFYSDLIGLGGFRKIIRVNLIIFRNPLEAFSNKGAIYFSENALTETYFHDD